MQPINTDSKRLHLDWKQKLQVLDEAYEKGFGIKPTARKYGLYPHRSRLWKKRRCEIEERGWTSRQYSKHLLKLQKIRTPDDCEEMKKNDVVKKCYSSDSNQLTSVKN